VADVNANIGVSIDTSQALAQLKALQRQISQFHTSIARSSESAALAQRDLQKNFINSVNSIGAFSAELRAIKSTAESFTDSLEKNKFGMREYFRYSAGATKTFSRFFKSEFDTINNVAEENVKRLQTQYIKMGRDANGVMRAIAIMPKELDLSNYTTQTQLAAQRQAIFNQLVKQGTTNLLNFGKNTQWAGRQLMVGFTIPLMALGTTASRTFMEMETAALKFRKVYGDLFTPTAEREQALADITALGQMFTKYGIAVSQTVGLAADAAAAGFQGLDLQRQVTEATRLSVLGQIDQQKALETTISLQNAFKLSNETLSESINFLNAVENQTVVSLDDITTAIPKVAPVIMQLGGNVKDLAFFLTAMKQGGVNASEGANALKSGLASLINPTERASDMLAGMGVNIKEIVERNKGDLRATVIDFARALDTLDPLARARAIEQLFGKFQFARLSTLFENVTSTGTQAARVLELAGYSASELAATAESELGMTAESGMMKFRKAVEDLKLSLVPVGETFLEAVTPIVEFIGGILEKFNNLSSGTKKAITILTVAIGAIGPVVLMTFGLLANALANILKGANILRNGYLRLTGQSQLLAGQTEYLTVEQQNAAAVAHSLDQTHARLTQTFNAEKVAIDQLAAAYNSAIGALARFAQANPGMMLPPGRRFNKGTDRVMKYSDGVIMVPGSGNQDTVPAMLTPGEAVIPAEMVKRYGPLITGMVAGNIPGYQRGRKPISQRAANVPIYPDIAVRFQSSAENQAQRASVPNLAEVLGPLAARVGEARGLGFGQTAQSAYPNIIDQYKPLVEEFLAKVQTAFDDNANTIANESERLAVSWQTAGQEISSEISSVSSKTDESVIRKALGVDPDSYGTVAANFRASHGFGGRTGRFPEGNVPTSYTTPAFKKAAGRAYEMVSGEKPTGMDIGHIFDIKTRQKLGMPTTVPLAELKADANTATATIKELERSISVAEQELANKINAASKTVKSAGMQIGDSAIQGIAQGTNASSPSKDAIQQGKNVSDGFEQGILEGMDDASLAATKVKTSATTALGGGGSTTMGAIFGGAGPSDEVLRTGDELLTKQKVAVDRMGQLNGKLMGATFAVSALSSITTMFSDGPLEKFSGIIAKITTAMFGLMTVTQLLTQTKILELVQTRAGLAKSAVANAMSAGQMFGGTSKALSGRAGFLGSLARGGLFVTKFLGPVGIATTALGLMTVAIKLNNARLEEQRKKLEAFSDALQSTTKQSDFLSDYFGFIPQKGSLENFGKELEALSAAQRSEREKLKQDKGFQEAFGGTIGAVSRLSDEQATSALTLKGLELISQGMAKEKVQELISAIKEEAGKTNIKLDFASLKFDEAGIKDLNNQVSTALKGFQDTYTNGLQKAFKYVAEGEGAGAQIKLVETLVPTKEAKAALKNAATGVSSYVGSINRLANSGSINIKQYNQMFDGLFNNIKTSVPDTNTQMALFNKVLKLIDPDLAKLVKGVDDLSKKQLALKAATVGVSEALIANFVLAVKTADALNKVAIAANSGGNLDVGAIAAAAQARNKALGIEIDIKKAIEDALKIAKELNKVQGDGTGGKKGFLQDEITALKNQIAAYKQLRIAKIDAATASELAGNAEMAALLKTKAGVQQNISAIREYAKLKREASLIQEAGAELGDATIADLNRKKAFLDLQEQLITMRYSHELERQNQALQDQEWALEQIGRKITEIENNQIRPLQDIIEENSYALEVIAYAEDKINKKYDEQEQILDNILTINEELAAVQKSRISIADALTRGDIAAAAQAVEDLRTQQRTIGGSNQRKTLQNARKQEIAALRRNDIEETNKTLQLQISQIQQEQIKNLEQQKRSIEDNINGIQDIIENIEYVTMISIRKMTDEISRRFGGTKTEIENALKILDLSKAAGIDINSESFITNVLKAAGGYASYINKLITDTPDLFQAVIDEIAKLRAEMELPIVPKIDTAPINEQYLAPKLEVSLPIMVPDASCPSGWAYYIDTYLDEGQGSEPTKISSIRVGCASGALDISTIKPTPTPSPSPSPSPSSSPKPTPTPSITVVPTPTPTASATPKPTVSPTPTASATPKPTVSPTPTTSPTPYPPGSFGPTPTINPALNAGLNTGGSTADLHLAELARIAAATAYANSLKSITENAGAVAAGHYADLTKIAEATAKANATAAANAAKNAGLNTVSTANMPFGGGSSTSAKIISGGGGAGLYGPALMASKGGMIKPKYFARGSLARGTDKIPAMLTPGEFIMNKYAVQGYGLEKMKAINSGTYSGDSVYNYSVNVNVESGSNPDDIARAVMSKIRQIDSQRIRTQR
jgi:TP901 family phage tail tape measure protein